MFSPTREKLTTTINFFKFLYTVWYDSKFKVHGPVHRKNILIYIQQNATLGSLFYLETALHVSGNISTHHLENKQLYLQNVVFATPLILPAASGR
jgi:hypothetical protein